jgi:type II secretory pathway component PulM
MRLGSRDRRAIGLGALVLAPALCWSLVLHPYVRARGALRDRVREQRALLERELALVAASRGFPAALENARRALASRRPRLFAGGDALAATAALVGVVGEEARRQGVLIDAIESRAPAAGDALVAVQIEVRGRGDAEGLLRWLAALESGPRLLRVEQLGVVRLDAGVPARSPDIETLIVSGRVSGYLLPAVGARAPDRAVATVEAER